MRIALSSEVFAPKVDGITNRLEHTLAQFARGGHEVLLFVPRGFETRSPHARVVPIACLPFPPHPELRAALPDPALAWHLLRFRPDVLHAVGPVCLGLQGLLAARALGIPAVASYHTDLARYVPLYGLGAARGLVWPFVRAVHGLAELNLAPSRATANELEAHGIPQVGLWRGGVDAERFHPSRRSLALRGRLTGGHIAAPLVLYAGRLSPEKNLDALAVLVERLPEVRLAFVGDGPSRAGLERRFADQPAVFTGYLRGSELAAAMASADVFAMPSATETLGFVVLEAMAAGCPIVAAGAGGVTELVEHGATGLLFDPEKPEELVHAVSALLRSRALSLRLAQRARALALGSGWAQQTDRLLKHYREVICARRRRSLIGRLVRA